MSKAQTPAKANTQLTPIPALNKHITAIDRLNNQTVKAVFEIAVRLNVIATEKLYEYDGSPYKKIEDFASTHFGYARSTTLNYIKIARDYLQVETIKDGKREKTEIRTICAHIDKDGKTNDYKIGQLNAMGKTSPEDFRTMDKEGIISPDMSADAIRKAVTAWYEPDEPEDNEPDEIEDNEEITETFRTCEWAREIVRQWLICIIEMESSGESADIIRTWFSGVLDGIRFATGWGTTVSRTDGFIDVLFEHDDEPEDIKVYGTYGESIHDIDIISEPVPKPEHTEDESETE